MLSNKLGFPSKLKIYRWSVRGPVFSVPRDRQIIYIQIHAILGFQILYRVTHKGLDFRDDCTEFFKTFPALLLFIILVGWGEECRGVGWRVCDTSSRQITEVKHTCPQPVTGLVSRLVFTGSIPVLHTNLWFHKHLKPTSG